MHFYWSSLRRDLFSSQGLQKVNMHKVATAKPINQSEQIPVKDRARLMVPADLRGQRAEGLQALYIQSRCHRVMRVVEVLDFTFMRQERNTVRLMTYFARLTGKIVTKD